jgi:hypothetical protein
VPASASLRIDPLADIGWTILQLDTLRFAACKELQGISIDQRYVLQIEREALTDCFQAEEALQLGNILNLYATTQGKDHAPVGRPLDSHHGFLVT